MDLHDYYWLLLVTCLIPTVAIGDDEIPAGTIGTLPRFNSGTKDHHFMDSNLIQYKHYPIQTIGWNITFDRGAYTLMQCYDDCFAKGCRMFYHTHLNKCWVFEFKIHPSTPEHIEELPRQEIVEAGESVFIYVKRYL
ncbi:uncharacterized protein [Clytia hemisphaerica]|uniref:Apple domain-containing protein n=1 Tax=Clytia hemisphaerica TaxID=252671 RepID=A0A7M5X8M7_9CNID